MPLQGITEKRRVCQTFCFQEGTPRKKRGGYSFYEGILASVSIMSLSLKLQFFSINKSHQLFNIKTHMFIVIIYYIQLSKFCTLAITIYHYPNLDLMVAIAKTVLNLLQIAKNENNILWKIKILEKKVMVRDIFNSDIEQFIEKFDLKIKLVLFLYISFDCIL